MATQTLALTTAALAATTRVDDGSSSYQTMGIGAGNGSVVQYTQCRYLVLCNDTGGSITYTILAPNPTIYGSRSMALGDMSIAVADGNILVVPVSAAFNDGGSITIECSAAGKIMALRDFAL